jgi:DNA-binding response OmpR family regulator
MGVTVPKILLIEADAVLRGFLTRVLRECGCSVEAVGSYREGLARAEVNHFSLYLTDAELPDGSGVDLCRRIQTITTGASVVICYSRDGQDRIASQAGAQASLKIGEYMTHQLHQVLNQLVGMGGDEELGLLCA